MNSSALALSIVCWTARILAMGLLMVWGGFFLEHLKEWFTQPLQASPLIWVWLAQLAHLVILVGLIALWRWPIGGSLATIAGSLLFFGGLTISAVTAGHPYLAFVAFFAITIIPALLSLVYGLMRRRAGLSNAASAPAP
jgi:hypothetical protein